MDYKMIVTRFQYPLEKNLIRLIDKMCDRCTQNNPKRDSVLLIEGGEGEGKCQPAGNKVLMADGTWKNIEDINEGDLIISPQKDGTNIFSKVTKLYSWFCNNNYEVIQLNKVHKKLYTCSNNHLIPLNITSTPRVNTIRRYDKKFWKLENYKADYYSSLSKFLKTNATSLSSFKIDSFLGRENCKIEPYSLGVYLGDGSFSVTLNKYGHISKKLVITNSDFKILEELSKSYTIMNVYRYKDRNTFNYSYSVNGEFATELINLGLDGKGSGSKFIPEEALLSDYNYRMRLLAGLIDTDGYYHHGGYYFTLKSRKLIEDIKSLVYSLGGRTGEIMEVKKSCQTGAIGTYYKLTLYVGDLNLPIFKDNKKKKGSLFYLSPNRISIDIIKSKPAQVYGFSIDSPSSWYITDNWMVTHNSGYSVALGYYISEKTGRPFDVSRIFFDVKKMIDFIKSTDNEIVIWDEPALQALSGDALTTVVKDLTRLLMMCRKKRHFVIINMTYFTKFGDYIVWQRPLGMIHVYSRDEVTAGRFVYLKKRKLEYLWNEWKSKKKRSYKKYASKGIRGSFPDVLNPEYRHNVLAEFDVDAYEAAKDAAIQMVGADKTPKLTRIDVKLLKMQYKLSQSPINKQELAKILGIDDDTIYMWRRIPEKYPQLFLNGMNEP